VNNRQHLNNLDASAVNQNIIWLDDSLPRSRDAPWAVEQGTVQKPLRRIVDASLKVFGRYKVPIRDVAENRLQIVQRLRGPDEARHAACSRSAP
jgi:hypothetical protein